MFKFVKLGVTMAGLLLLVGFLTYEVPERAEASIRGNLTVINNTGSTITARVTSIGGVNSATIANGGTAVIGVGQAQGTTTLQADDGGFTVWTAAVSSNRNDVTWVLAPGGQSAMFANGQRIFN